VRCHGGAEPPRPGDGAASDSTTQEPEQQDPVCRSPGAPTDHLHARAFKGKTQAVLLVAFPGHGEILGARQFAGVVCVSTTVYRAARRVVPSEGSVAMSQVLGHGLIAGARSTRRSVACLRSIPRGFPETLWSVAMGAQSSLEPRKT
jgi:hypothetical protein